MSLPSFLTSRRSRCLPARPARKSASHRFGVELLEDRTVPSFFAPASYPIDNGPQAVAVGDFNGDGKQDLVTANSDAGDLSVLLGNGDGTFQPARNVDAGSPSPSALAVGDFNADGKLDLVVTDFNSGNVSVLLGNGDGTFQAPLSFVLPNAAPPNAVAVGDLNGDGKLDLVVASGDLNVFLGRGDGTFSPDGGVSTGFYASNSIALADFNGDGKLDVASTATTSVSVFPGNGDGSFAAPASYSTGQYTSYLTVGDFNGDGKLDIAAAINPEGPGPGGVSLLLNNGNGTFQAARNYALGLAPTSISAGDFNRDGKLDLALATPDGSNVTVLLGNGDGTFQSAQTYAAGPGGYSMAVADFNGDSFPDLVVANDGSGSGLTSTVSVLLNSANWSAPQASSFTVYGFPSPSTAGIAGAFTVTVRYADGSTDTNYTGTVNVTSTDAKAALPWAYTFTTADAGVHSFSATLKTAGIQSFTVADAENASVFGTQSGIAVIPAAASSLVLNGPSRVRAGAAFSLTVTAYDAYGNVATGYRGTLHFTSSDSAATLPSNYTFTATDAGVHVFTGVVLRKKRTQTITVTDTVNALLMSALGIYVA